MYIFLFNDFSNSVFVKMLSLHLQVTMDVYEKFNIFISIPKYSQRLILVEWISKNSHLVDICIGYYLFLNVENGNAMIDICSLTGFM